MLELRDITKRFGDVLANDHINIKVARGTIHAIVGENGAGKSTAMRIAYGFYTADEGEILVDGEVRRIQSPHDAIALGIGMVHQHFMLVEPMTVAENIVLGAEPGGTASLDLNKAASEIRALSDEFRLAVDPNATIETLSVGQQQRVEILKALYRRARILILDEPTAVLTPQETDEIFAVLRRLASEGHSIVFISHKLYEVLEIADRITVIRRGRVVGERVPSETDEDDLAELMVGREVQLVVDRGESHPAGPMLTIHGLEANDDRGQAMVRGVELEVRAGEIL